MTRPVPRVLAIAGTDPTGGAGLHADLKTITALGGYGMGAVTAVVAQNTHGVRAVSQVEPGMVREQLLAVSDDVTIDAVKIGMLGDAPTTAVVHAWLADLQTGGPGVPVVLDPVMIASSGDRLLRADAESALRDLLPLATLLTPNLPELAALTGRPEATGWEQAVAEATALAARTGTAVLLKGGHLPGDEVPDALVAPDGQVLARADARRVVTRSGHGTGCSLSSALATLQARTGDWPTSLRAAKTWLTGALEQGDALEVGSGHGPVHHGHHLTAAVDALIDG